MGTSFKRSAMYCRPVFPFHFLQAGQCARDCGRKTGTCSFSHCFRSSSFPKIPSAVLPATVLTIFEMPWLGRVREHEVITTSCCRLGRTLRTAYLSASNKRHGSTPSPYERRQRSSDGRRRWWSRSSSTLSRATASYDSLRGLEVLSVEDGRSRDILSLWSGQSGEKCLLVFLTHWADLGSWEYAQSLNYVLTDIASCGSFSDTTTCIPKSEFQESLYIASVWVM